ncbi:MAG: protein kinase [Acidobacteriota bacterium]|nr:protein kinase [Acidobacteriota bacterium]
MQLPARLGKYELQQFLGGGMSHVYRAQDTIIGRTVAVKILTEQGAQDQEARDRFLDEARTAAKVTHENVINIYDFGVDPEKGLFMVMEFLEGEDLRNAIRNGHTGDLRNKLKIALQAARALDFIHSNRIIHRDVKPENLHITTNGQVKLMDFGIAKSEDFSRTQPGFALGTPYYMAPEQVRGEKVTTQADVYAFGIVLFELLTGQKPFTADSVDGIFYHILNVPLKTEALAAAEVPPPIIDLVVACTAKNAADRPQGLGPVAAGLEVLLAIGTTQTQAAPSPAAETAARTPSAAPPAEPKKGLSPALLGGIAAVVVAAAVGGYFALRPAPVPPTTEKKEPAKQELPATVSTPTGTMVLVPAGQFQYGQQKAAMFLPAFYIDKTEVTNAAYQQFSQATGHPLPPGFPTDKPGYPVVDVTVGDARDFARWAGERLPTAYEWEKAARGTDGRLFPWGSDGDTSRANVGSNQLQPADGFASGASPYGGLQFVGNAWEIVDQVRQPPSDVRRFQSLKPPPQAGEAWYMIRGQSAAEPLLQDVIWDSYGVPERWRDPFIGFRCAKDAPR